MPRALITGITGFIGGYLAQRLVSQGFEVWGSKRWRTAPTGLRQLGVLGSPHLHIFEGDILDPGSVSALIQAAQPDVIFHLAAQSYPKESWSAPWYTFDVNVRGTVNLFEAVRSSSFRPRIHIPGSAAQYGPAEPTENPIKEQQEFRPSSPYAVSKCTQELLARQYRLAYGLDTVVTRSFIHTGPGQGDRCVLQTFCAQAARIEAGKQEPMIGVGNLSPVRDFTDVRDVAIAFASVAAAGKAGEAYNIGSGQGTRIQDLLDMVLKESGAKIEVRVEKARLRPVDEPMLVADTSKVRRATGWTAAIPLRQTVKDVLEDWRRQVREE